MKVEKAQVKNFIRCLGFLVVLAVTFLAVTYLFRSVDPLARNNILWFYEEEKDSLDVVIVGSSSAYRYFSPMDAWDQYGFTSYDYCTPAMSATTVLSVVKDVEKHQSPKVIVLDVRSFLPGHMHEKLDFSVRNVLDVWDVGVDRMEAVKYSCDAYEMDWEESLSEYIDLIQYHDNYSVLLDKDQWHYIDNRANPEDLNDSIYKGYSLSSQHVYLEDARGNLTDETAELTETSERLYREMLDYCEEKGIQALLTVSPYYFSEEEFMEINSLEKIAEERGFLFLNANKYLDEMGIDYAEDFYNEGHVNTQGAKKYTEFVSRYLVDHFEIPDHRGDAAYDSWKDTYEVYAGKLERTEKSLNSTMKNQNAAFALQEEMKATTSADDWLWMAKNKKFTLFMFKAGNMSAPAGTKMILDGFGMEADELMSEDAYMYLYSGGLLYGSAGDTEVELEAGQDNAEQTFKMKCEDAFEIYLLDEPIRQQEMDGIYIAAYDNIRGVFFDDVFINIAEDGTLRLSR